jgi:hypothetical protein
MEEQSESEEETPMFGIPPFTWLLIVWSAITAVLVLLLIWRSLVGMREEDQIFLDETEDRLAKEQRQIIAKLQRITTYAKGLGFASGTLLLVIAGLWIYRAFTSYNRPTFP